MLLTAPAIVSQKTLKPRFHTKKLYLPITVSICIKTLRLLLSFYLFSLCSYQSPLCHEMKSHAEPKKLFALRKRFSEWMHMRRGKPFPICDCNMIVKLVSLPLKNRK